MATQAIPDKLTPLIVLAEDAADGAQTHGAAVGLVQNTAAKIRADLHALMGDPVDPVTTPGAQNIWLQKKAAKTAATAAKLIADSNAKAFLAGVVNHLKFYLGSEWSSAWEAVGLSGGSMKLPTTPDKRFAMLSVVKAYFVAHPAHELIPPVPVPGDPPKPEFSADRAQALHTACSDTRTASLESNAAAGTAKANRNAKQTALFQRMSGLLGELGQLLGFDDALWYAFGFSRPSDPEQPQQPENLTLVAGAAESGMAFADWDDARRAERYRVIVRDLTINSDPVALTGDVSESEFVITDQVSGHTIEVWIIAVNDAGDSPESGHHSIVVP